MNESDPLNTPADPLEKWLGSNRASWIRFTCLLALTGLILKLVQEWIRFFIHKEPMTIEIRLAHAPVLITYALSSWFFVFKPLLEKVIKKDTA